MKAIVIDIVNDKAALLKEDGSVIKVDNKNYQLGEEVTIKTADVSDGTLQKAPLRPVRIRRRFAVAALAAALFMCASICAYAMPYGTVTQGNDSAIEYTINVFDRVIGVKANSEQSEEVLKEAGNLKNKKIDEAVALTIEAGTDITVETPNEKHDNELTKKIHESVKLPQKEEAPSSSDIIVEESAEKITDPSQKQEDFVPDKKPDKPDTDDNKDISKTEDPGKYREDSLNKTENTNIENKPNLPVSEEHSEKPKNTVSDNTDNEAQRLEKAGNENKSETGEFAKIEKPDSDSNTSMAETSKIPEEKKTPENIGSNNEQPESKHSESIEAPPDASKTSEQSDLPKAPPSDSENTGDGQKNEPSHEGHSASNNHGSTPPPAR